MDESGNSLPMQLKPMSRLKSTATRETYAHLNNKKKQRTKIIIFNKESLYNSKLSHSTLHPLKIETVTLQIAIRPIIIAMIN
jgi:hypothetical protein